MKIDNREAEHAKYLRTKEIIKYCTRVLFDGVPLRICSDTIDELFPPDPVPPPFSLLKKWNYHSPSDMLMEMITIGKTFGINVYMDQKWGITFTLVPPTPVDIVVAGVTVKGFKGIIIPEHEYDGFSR